MAQIELTRANAWKNFGLLIEAVRVLATDVMNYFRNENRALSN